MRIRYAQAEDLPALTEIFNYYVLNGHISFDTEPQTPEQRLAWFMQYREQGPYRLWVAESPESDMRIQGCAYSSAYRAHPAFAATIETSIYLHPQATGQGLGTALYERLFSELASEDLHLAVAGIALPNQASIRLHKRLGFTEVGIFDEYACKHGRYISSIWLQKRLK